MVAVGDATVDTLESTIQRLFALASKTKCTTAPRLKDSINSKDEVYIFGVTSKAGFTRHNRKD